MSEPKITGCFDNLATNRREWYKDGEIDGYLCATLIVGHAKYHNIEVVPFGCFNDLPAELKDAPKSKALQSKVQQLADRQASSKAPQSASP